MSISSLSTERRKFLKQSLLGTAGLMIGVRAHAGGHALVKLFENNITTELNPFVLIDAKGVITLVNSRPDMGQGSIQAVTSLIAEELEVRMDQIQIMHSDGQAKYGSQGSGGSSTVRGLWFDLRKAGAAAKEMLVRTAAGRWNTSPESCQARDGAVFLPGTDKKFSYGELAVDAAKLDVPKNPKLKDPKDFKILGKYHKRSDIPSKVNGTAVFGIDVVVPGMLYATVIHAPSVQGKLVRYDSTQAMAVAGVKQVIKTEHSYPGGKSEAIAVIAENYWAALKASKLVTAQWDHGDLAQTLNTDKYFKDAYAAAARPGVRAEEDGDFDALFTASEKKLESIYETPFLAHAAIEPVNATAHVKEDGSVEVWAPIQGPDGALGETADYLGIPTDKIKIHPQLLGGSFGRKAFMDFMKEAIDLSRQVKAPVKLIWSREEDMMQGPFRPAMLSRMRGVIGNNRLSALSHQAIGESIQGQHWNGLADYQADDWLAGELSKENHKYGFPVHHLSYSRVKTPIPILWWRSVYASNFAWGQECFIDEMAHKAGLDPLAARKQLLRNSKRDLAILEKLEEIIKSSPALPEGHARGIAMFRSFESMSAAMVEIARKDKGARIVKVTSIIDCGQYVNPDNVKAQTEGNIAMGLSSAIKGGITFSEGKCDQTNYHQFQVMRMSEMPVVEVHIMDNLENPGGVGEPGLPPIAPALGNAIFNLTQKRIYKLPVDLDNLV